MFDEKEKETEEEKSGASEKEAEKTEIKVQKSEKGEAKKLSSELEAAKKEIGKLSDELEAANDKYLRMLAEYDNFRRRTQKDRENIYADAYSDALKELLPILDNIERAMDFSDSASFADGMKAIVGQVSSAMEKLGIETFGKAGETFDPMLHNAVMHIEDENLGENVIADVFQKGYKKGDRIIRHAMVKVAN